MGMFKSREVPRGGQKSLPFATPMQRARKTPAVVGAAGAWLAIRVPTVGLHHKGATVFPGGKAKFAPHADKPELVAAKKLYDTALPLIPAPIAGPLRLRVEFVLEPAGNVEAFDGVLPYTGRPDRSNLVKVFEDALHRSNLVKVFEDALRRKGWMTDDSLVVETPGGKWVSFDHRYQGVWFGLGTITREEESQTYFGAGRFSVPAFLPDPIKPSQAHFVTWPHREPAEHR